MESPNSQGKNQAMADDDLPGETSANNSTREMSLSPKPDQQLNSSDSMETSPPEEPKPLDDQAMEQVDDDQEYVCRYCNKKFNNKQALGGHQNAHKAERALEKCARERARIGAGYLGNEFYTYTSMNSSQYYPNSFTRYHEHLSLQPMPNRYYPYPIPPPPPYPQNMMPMAQDPYAPRLLPGPNNTSNNYRAAGWPRPIMATRPPMGMQNPGESTSFLPPPLPGNGGATGGGGAAVGISAGPSSSRLINNADNNNQQAEEPELDLTLKL